MSGSAWVEVERRLAAPVAEVFQWWTEPARLARWMTPMGTVEATVDLRVGGALHVVTRGGDVVIEHSGTFLEIDPPRRLVFTWASPFTGPEPCVVTVDLQSDGPGATILRLRHSQLPDAASESHSVGWGAMLDRLATELKEGQRHAC